MGLFAGVLGCVEQVGEGDGFVAVRAGDSNGLPQVEQVTITSTTASASAYIDHDPTTSQPLTIRTTNGNEAFYVYDGLSRPIALVNSAGTTGTYTYDPYGVTSTGGTGQATGQSPYRFAPGSIDDRTTGMLKYGQRWYQPITGRFTQRDWSGDSWFGW